MPKDPVPVVLADAEHELLAPAALDRPALDRVLASIHTHDVDFADLYFQHSRFESWSLEEGIVKSGTFSIDRGVGVRAVTGERQAYAYSDDVSQAALDEAADHRPRIDVYDTATLGAAAAYQRALAAGARSVAGPLLKEDVAAVVAASPLPVPTVVSLGIQRKLSRSTFESNMPSPTSKIINSRVIVSAGTTGAVVVSHPVAPLRGSAPPVPYSVSTAAW